MSEPQPDLIDRFRGCLLGCAVGDALGAPFEGYWDHQLPGRKVASPAGSSAIRRPPRGIEATRCKPSVAVGTDIRTGVGAMRRPRVQFTLSRLMAVVALAGLCAAAARVHAGLGAFAVGCSALGLARTCTAIDRRRATGRPVGSVRAVMVLLDSLGVGAVILALSAAGSCFAAVCGYVLILRFAPSREGSPLGVTVVGTTGLLGAAATWALSRRHFWPYRYWRD